MNKTSNIQRVITTDDKHSINEIAELERLLQPTDNWDVQAITDLIAKDYVNCGAVLSPNLSQLKQSRVIAYCIWSEVFEVAEILRVGTHPDYRRQGLANALLSTIIKTMPEQRLGRIMLEVRADNKPAITLYDKLGFKQIHKRVDYYKPKVSGSSKNCDALIMQYG